MGVDRAAPAPHRRITLERTHHLCSFVELSHFNPRPGPFGNQLHTPPPNTEPHSRAPGHAALQLSALPPLCCCSLVSGTHSQTHTFTKATPTTGLPHVCQDHQVGWRGRGFDSLTLCWSVCLTFLLLFKRKTEKKREIYYLRYLFLRVDYVDALRVET